MPEANTENTEPVRYFIVGIANTDIGTDIGILKYSISVRFFGILTQHYSIPWMLKKSGRIHKKI